MESIPANIEELLELLKNAATRDEPNKRFRLNNGQLARLSYVRDHDSGYTRAQVSLETPSIEKAIVAAIVALQGEEIEPKRVRRSLAAAKWTRESLQALAVGDPKPERPVSTSSAKAGDVSDGFGLLYVEDLLRHYRPDFDDMTEYDQATLVTRIVEHANEFLTSLRKLAASIQHADPYEGLPNSPVKEAARDVRAAELRDIEGLSYVEIGERVGVKQTKHDAARRDNLRVRTRLVPHGRTTLENALGGEEGYKEFITSAKKERDRWRALDEESRYSERYAQLLEIPAERMRRIMTGTDEDWAEEAQALDEKQTILALVARAGWETFRGD
jgi:hypothetical protein